MKDEKADEECYYGGEENDCSHYMLTWHQDFGSGSRAGGHVGSSSRHIIEFLAEAANAAEARLVAEARPQ